MVTRIILFILIANISQPLLAQTPEGIDSLEVERRRRMERVMESHNFDSIRQLCELARQPRDRYISKCLMSLPL